MSEKNPFNEPFVEREEDIEPPEQYTRRGFLKKAPKAVIGAGLTYVGMRELRENALSRYESRISAETDQSSVESNPLLPVDLQLLHEHSPNENFIRTHALSILTIPPGGYNAALESRKPADIHGKGEEAYKRHAKASDKRSITEMELVDVMLEHVPGRTKDESLQKVIKPRSIFSGEQLQDVTAGDLLLLLQVLGSRHARKKVLHALHDMTQKGKLSEYGIEPLDEEKQKWARSAGMAPWNLAWAEAMKPLAKMCLQLAPEVWFDGLTEAQRTERLAYIKEHDVSNPGIVAMLEHTETFDMTYIGDVPFITQINDAPGQYPTAMSDMLYIAEYLKEEWHLPYTQAFQRGDKERKAYQYIPGSLRWNTNASGGAVFGQFMPINLVHFTKKYEHTRQKLREHHDIELPPLLPGSPWAMSLLKYLYLNGEWRAVQGHAPDKHVKSVRSKGGYVVGDPRKIKGALKSWNPHKKQIDRVYSAGIDYYKTFSQNYSAA